MGVTGSICHWRPLSCLALSQRVAHVSASALMQPRPMLNISARSGTRPTSSRLAEKVSAREGLPAARRSKRHDAARSSQRAWREELLDAEGKIEGPANEPLLSELPVLGREQQSGRAETRHGHVHALGRSKNTRSRCGAV